MAINGIDFTTIENFREKVALKLSETQTVELPLILGRDAPYADGYISKVNFLSTKYAMLYSKANDLENEVNKIDEKDEKAIATAINVQADEGLKWLEERQELDRKMGEVTAEILQFITPYIKDIKLENGKTLVDTLYCMEPKWTIQVLRCMYLGAEALKPAVDDEEEDSEESKKVKQG